MASNRSSASSVSSSSTSPPISSSSSSSLTSTPSVLSAPSHLPTLQSSSSSVQSPPPSSLPSGTKKQINSRTAWRQLIQSLYPDALNVTYCVPPVFFNRVPYSRDVVAGQPVLTLQPPLQTVLPGQKKYQPNQLPQINLLPSLLTQYSLWPQEFQQQSQASPLKPVLDSDRRDDFAQIHVLTNLQELGNDKHEVMFILSQINFTDYLNQPSYTAAAKQLPRPANLGPKYADGDFDFIIITRKYGILIIELKSVGKSHAKLKAADADVAKRVEKAIKQLDKAEIVVQHIMSDIAPGLSAKKTLCLPYVSKTQLQRVLTADPRLEQAVCQSVGAASSSEAVELSLCSELLSDPSTYWHVTPAVLSQLGTWWQNRMTCTVDTLLTDDLYLDIVARFVGPATTVRVHCPFPPRLEIRLLGEAIAELGKRLARLVLTPQQLDLLKSEGQNTFMFHVFKLLLFRPSQWYLWTAGMQNSNTPRGLQAETLTVPVRSAPSVLREIQVGLNKISTVDPYTDIGVASPGDGVKTIHLRHQGQGHNVLWPADCRQCGCQVAEVLRRLNVGMTSGTTPKSPKPLEYRDVFVLTRNMYIHDDVINDRGRMTSRASGVVLGLRDAGIPVRVLDYEQSPTWDQSVADVAMARTDDVTVAFYKSVMGLERKVVVWLPGKIAGEDDDMEDEKIEVLDRVYTVSRCTTQLIIVDMPKIVSPDLD